MNVLTETHRTVCIEGLPYYAKKSLLEAHQNFFRHTETYPVLNPRHAYATTLLVVSSNLPFKEEDK